MTTLREWRDRDGALVPGTLRTEGFAHAAPDDTAMLAVANAFHRDVSEPQVVLAVDTALVGARVRWEVPDPAPPGSAPGATLPRIHGPIPERAVVGVRYVRRDPWGGYLAFEARTGTAERFDLVPSPEGGWYRRTWQTGVPAHPTDGRAGRDTATAILFLLGPGETSRWHRLRSDELWVFNRGGPLSLVLGGSGESPEASAEILLGSGAEEGHGLQAAVPAGTWQCARPVEPREALVTCVVSPGFDFADFEAGPTVPPMDHSSRARADNAT
ncbi:hypothetical protein SAMN02745673_00256 [Marinactinospora thermotolerans DSM 45154]|uniref:DUF985 domain-containing protein n=2 Tax=Marinactinospora thermotolerans TaxID=531310 RepID=A0A1T4K9Q1_9ACTN|nr:hypothetical protein SAMN02745673_00256 [Marinactinospora thermotolerans DSM 45154]